MAKSVWGEGSGAGTDHNLGTAINWTGDTLPANDDTVVFNETCVEDATDGLDMSAKHFAQVQIAAGYTGNIGADDGPLLVSSAADTGTVIMNGSGEVYVSGQIAQVVQFDGTLGVGDDIATLNVFGGACEVLASAAVGAIVLGQSGSAEAPTLAVPATATIGAVACFKGTGTCEAPVTTLDVLGGTWNQSDDVTTLSEKAGTVNWTDGDITTARCYGGTLDGSAGEAARTITLLERFTSSSVNLANGVFNIVVTTDRCFGGTEVLDAGREYSLS